MSRPHEICPECGRDIPRSRDGLCPHCLLSMLLPAEPELGKIGPYHLTSLLGEGGFGRVYAAEQVGVFYRQVAIKLLKNPGDRAAVSRFQAEAQALSLLDHPGIVRFYDSGKSEEFGPWMCLEFIVGLPITIWCQNTSATVQERLRLMRSVCDAVEEMHRNGIIHRDLKPANILIDESSRQPKLIDLGIVRSLQATLHDDATLTGTMNIIGTPAYLSPEQTDGSARKVDARSDVYALGVILYEVLAGETPLAASGVDVDSPFEVLKAIRETTPPPLSGRMPGISKPLDAVLGKALVKDPEHRFQSARDLGEALKIGEAEKAVDRRWRGRLRNLTAPALVALLLLLLGLGLHHVLNHAGMATKKGPSTAFHAPSKAGKPLKKPVAPGSRQVAIDHPPDPTETSKRERPAIYTLIDVNHVQHPENSAAFLTYGFKSPAGKPVYFSWNATRDDPYYESFYEGTNSPPTDPNDLCEVNGECWYRYYRILETWVVQRTTLEQRQILMQSPLDHWTPGSTSNRLRQVFHPVVTYRNWLLNIWRKVTPPGQIPSVPVGEMPSVANPWRMISEHEVGVFLDKYLWAWVFEKPNGERFSFALDVRYGASTGGRFFRGERWPEDANGEPVVPDSEMDQLILAVLISWIDAQMSHLEQIKLLETPADLLADPRTRQRKIFIENFTTIRNWRAHFQEFGIWW